MIKLATEPADTVEERQGLPSEEVQKRHMVHQAHPATRLRFQKTSELAANATKTFHGRESPRLFDFEFKTKGSTRIRSYRDFVQQ